LVALTLIAAACNTQRTPIPQDWGAKSPADKRALFDKLADDCHLPRDTFRFDGDRLRFIPHADEQYEHVECALEALKVAPGLPKMSFGGNERYDENLQ
jgi:hypothetical protein